MKGPIDFEAATIDTVNGVATVLKSNCEGFSLTRLLYDFLMLVIGAS